MNINLFKITLLIISFLIEKNANAQKELTNGQVYNFEVGDIIQGVHDYSGVYPNQPGPPTYETHFILKKAFSTKQDTIFYTIRRSYFTPQRCDTCHATDLIDTIIQPIMHLNDLAIHYNESTECTIKDSFYSSFCNRNVWAKSPGKLDSMWFEPVEHFTYFVEGLGGPYFSKDDPHGPIHTSYILNFFKKNGTTCGEFYSGLQNFKNQKLHATISPNPFTENATIQFEKPLRNAIIVLYNFEGQKTNVITNFQGSIYEVSRGNLKAGIYFLQVNDINGSWSQKIVIQ